MRNLEIGDDVDDNIIGAYNTLIKGPRHVVHGGRPREGDKVRNTYRDSVWRIQFSCPNTNTNIFGLSLFGQNQFGLKFFGKYKYIRVDIGWQTWVQIYSNPFFFYHYKYKFIGIYQKWENMNTTMIIWTNICKSKYKFYYTYRKKIFLWI